MQNNGEASEVSTNVEQGQVDNQDHQELRNSLCLTKRGKSELKNQPYDKIDSW